jgi:biopolymer transport protein ExbB/TolQ
MMDLLFKALAMLRVRRFIQAARGLRSSSKEELANRAAVLDRSPWPLLRSLGGHVRAVLDGVDADRSHAQFRHECELEAERGAAGYGLVRLFIWAMPILGFIGTVMGIGEAVSEFAGFLSGDIEDIDLVKAQLSGVSTGLSFAFDTTLLGLGASLVAMVAVSLVQRQEEGALAEVEQAGLTLLAVRERGAVSTEPVGGLAEDSGRLVGALSRLSSEFREHTRELSAATEGLAREMNPLRASMGAHTQEIARVAQAGQGEAILA